MKDIYKKLIMNDKYKKIGLRVIAVIIVMLPILIVFLLGDKSTKKDKYNCYDEFKPTYRTYDGVLVPYYKTDSYAEDYCMSYYVYRTIKDLIDVPFDISDYIMEGRGIYLDILYSDNSKNKIYIEQQVDNTTPNRYYIKISNNYNSDQTYYIIDVNKKDDNGNYEITKNKTSYNKVKDKITKFNNKLNPWIDDRTYTESLLDYLNNKQNVYMWEGQNEDLTVDSLMKILGYK